MTTSRRKRWFRFDLRTMLVATLLIAFLILFVWVTVQNRQNRESWQTQTISIRLTSSGTVKWGKDIRIADFEPDLTREVRLFISQGVKPRLLIQCYSDAREADITELKAIGRNAGCDIVDIERLNFPSPVNSDVF